MAIEIGEAVVGALRGEVAATVVNAPILLCSSCQKASSVCHHGGSSQEEGQEIEHTCVRGSLWGNATCKCAASSGKEFYMLLQNHLMEETKDEKNAVESYVENF